VPALPIPAAVAVAIGHLERVEAVKGHRAHPGEAGPRGCDGSSSTSQVRREVGATLPTQLIALIQAVPPIRGMRGQPLRRPSYPYADRDYDHEVYPDKVRRFQITPHLARRGTGHGSGLGVYRWVVEGAIALLHWFRRLRIRWEIRDDIHEAFMTLAAAIICWRRLIR
jgi:hypothetical protein